MFLSLETETHTALITGFTDTYFFFILRSVFSTLLIGSSDENLKIHIVSYLHAMQEIPQLFSQLIT